MTKKSPSRLAKDRVYDATNFMPNCAMPEDIPVLFRKTAEELAGCFYEQNKRSPTFRAHWGQIGVYRYVRLNWPSFVPVAKEVLGEMMQMPGVSDLIRNEVYEAFLQQAETPQLNTPQTVN